MVGKQNRSLADFLASEAFATAEKSTVEASEEDIEGFNVFLERYKHGLAVEKAAVQHLK